MADKLHNNKNIVECWRSPIDVHIEVIHQEPDELNPGSLKEVGICKFCGRVIKVYHRAREGRRGPQCIPNRKSFYWERGR